MLGLFDYHVKASGTDIKAYYQEIYSCMSENCTKSEKYGLELLDMKLGGVIL